MLQSSLLHYFATVCGHVSHMLILLFLNFANEILSFHFALLSCGKQRFKPVASFLTSLWFTSSLHCCLFSSQYYLGSTVNANAEDGEIIVAQFTWLRRTVGVDGAWSSPLFIWAAKVTLFRAITRRTQSLMQWWFSAGSLACKPSELESEELWQKCTANVKKRPYINRAPRKLQWSTDKLIKIR